MENDGCESWEEVYDSILKKEGTILIQSYLDAGNDVNAYNGGGETLLSCAAVCGDMEIIEFLVQNGADANIPNSDGSKPMHWASLHGHADIVKFFLNKGFDIDCRVSDDLTILHNASERGHFDLVKYLVSNKCAIDSKSSSGMTPLLSAAGGKHFNIVEYLVESGADLNCRCNEGLGVLHYICVGNLYDKESVDIVKYLLKKGCDPSDQDIWQYTPLHIAAEYGNFEIVKHLLNAGADRNVENVNGHTPFSGVIRSPRCLEGITIFLENGDYFQSDHYNYIIGEPLLKEGILKNAKLCTQSFINKFNYADLPKVYEIPGPAQMLPRIEKMKIVSNCNIEQDIAESVKYEIETKEYCNVLNVCPIVLYCLCVRSLIQHNEN